MKSQVDYFSQSYDYFNTTKGKGEVLSISADLQTTAVSAARIFSLGSKILDSAIGTI
jgi:hypothetical protein